MNWFWVLGLSARVQVLGFRDQRSGVGASEPMAWEPGFGSVDSEFS